MQRMKPKEMIDLSNRERIAKAICFIQDVANDLAVGPTALGYLNEARVQLENAAQHRLDAYEDSP